MSHYLGRLQANAAATRYRHPAKGLRILAVAGPYGKTTTVLLLSELLQEAGKSVLALTNRGNQLSSEPVSGSYDTSAAAFQRMLALGRKKSVDFVIVEVTDELLSTHALETLLLEMSVITDLSESAHRVLEMPMAYTVVPSGLDVDSLKVAPHQAISYGEDDLAEAKLHGIKLFRKGTELQLVIDHQTNFDLATHLVGAANAVNVAAAVAGAYVLAIETTALEEGIARLERVVGNFDYIVEDRPYQVVVDGAYSADSVEAVLSSAKKLAKRRLLVVLDSSVSPEAYEVAKRLSDQLSVIGNVDEMPGVHSYATDSKAVSLTLRGAKLDDLVVLMGRKMAANDGDNLTHAQRVVQSLKTEKGEDKSEQ